MAFCGNVTPQLEEVEFISDQTDELTSEQDQDQSEELLYLNFEQQNKHNIRFN